jgi:hypothetical protein
MAKLIVGEIAFELVEALRPLIPRVQRHDRALAEADYSDPGNKRARLFTAAGSASETRAVLRVAVAWGYCTADEAAAALGLVERVVAMLWKLTHK